MLNKEYNYITAPADRRQGYSCKSESDLLGEVMILPLKTFIL